MRVISGVVRDGCKNCLTGYLRRDIPTGRLLLHFPISMIEEKTYQRFFNNQLFRMDDDFVLPKNIATSLGFGEEKVVIGRGTYPILHDEQFLSLSLRTSTNLTDLPLVA
ncbi:MAG: hypothetical protein AB8H12_17120 [Lewinella sp.]